MAAATDPRRLYREIAEVEKQLRELLRSNPLNVQDANAFRRRLMEKAQLLTQVNPSFAAQRELEQVLWKPCFYKRIEDFRRRIRKYASAPSNDRTVRDHFAKVSHEFQDFLKEASAFYENLRQFFTKYLLDNRVSRILSGGGGSSGPLTAATAPDAALQIDKCRTSLHRCLVFLGDLARYRELHSQKAKKNFVAAENCYYKALAVIPENGNPHNQLAVLATYVEAESVAVYRYCRSLLIAQPFATAEENLALLFERSRQRPLAPPLPALRVSTSATTPASSSKEKAAFLESFLHRLTRTHGILFSLATRQRTGASVTSPSAGAPSSSSSSSSSSVVPVYSKEMESLLMKDLAVLLASGTLSDALLLKLVVTNIFCIVKSTTTATADHALRLSIRMIAVVLDFVTSELSKQPTNIHSNIQQPSTTMSPAMRLLGAVSTFVDFLRFNGNVMDELDQMSSRSSASSDSSSFDVSKKLLDSLVQFLNHQTVHAMVATVEEGDELNDPVLMEEQLQLKENVELRGFKPLSPLVDVGSASRWRDDLAKNSGSAATSQPAAVAAAVDQAEHGKIRMWNIYRFGKSLCQSETGNTTMKALLLYYYQGQFTTSPPPVVPRDLNCLTSHNGMNTSGFAPSAVGGALFSGGGPLHLPPQPISSLPAKQFVNTSNSADDFDDEIIVYQPSPALAPSQPRGEGSSALGGSANFTLSSGDPFSLRGNSAFGASSLHQPLPPPPQQQQLQPQQPLQQPQWLSMSSPSDSLFGSFGSAGGSKSNSSDINTAIGSSLNYSGLNSFGNTSRVAAAAGNLGGAFSGGGFLSSPWQSAATTTTTTTQRAKSPVTSLSRSFSASHSTPTTQLGNQMPGYNSSSNSSLFGDMDDLAAVERESSLYQQKKSSLSAFLGPSPLSAASLAAPAWGGAGLQGQLPVSLPVRSSSVGGGSRPPPGFAPTASSSGGPLSARDEQQRNGLPPQPFFTRNPFVNP